MGVRTAAAGAWVPAKSAASFSSAATHTTSSASATPTSHGSGTSSSKPVSFIELAKLHGAHSLIGPLPTGGRFDSCCSGLVITRMEADGTAEATMVVDQKVENSYGTLHGGAIATLVDVMGTLALLAKDHKRGGVSVDLNVTYMAAIKVGQRMTCKGTVLKLGRTLGFTEVQLFTEEGKLAATGRHTKAM